jgi:hypothetical protein
VDEGWNWTSITRGFRLWGYDLVIKNDDGLVLELFVEARDDTKPPFVRTTLLSIAHGPLGDGLNAPTAGAVARRFGELLQAKEERATDEEVEELLSSFPLTEKDPTQEPVRLTRTSLLESGSAPVEDTGAWEGRDGGRIVADGKEQQPVRFSSKSGATNCDIQLFLKLFFSNNTTQVIDPEITVTGTWVDEDHPCIVTRLTFPDKMYLDIGLEPLGAHNAKTTSSKLHVMHRSLEFPLDPDRVISVMDRYAAFLAEVEANLSDEDIQAVFTRKWIQSDGSVGAVMEPMDPRSAPIGDDTPSEFAATNCDVKLYQSLYFGDKLPVKVTPGIEIVEVWVNENQPCLVNRVQFDDGHQLDLAIEPIGRNLAKIQTDHLHVMHGPVERSMEPDLIIEVMQTFADFMKTFESEITEADIKSIFTRKRLKDLG